MASQVHDVRHPQGCPLSGTYDPTLTRRNGCAPGVVKGLLQEAEASSKDRRSAARAVATVAMVVSLPVTAS